LTGPLNMQWFSLFVLLECKMIFDR
jgi:hypothetical protein